MSKFFVSENQINGNNISILDDDVNHIKNVLRLKIDDEIKICSIDTSKNYLCKIREIEKKSIECEIIEESEPVSESNIKLDIIYMDNLDEVKELYESRNSRRYSNCAQN